MGSPTDEEILDEIKLNILQEKRSYLTKYLNPDRYYAHLRSVFILTEDDEQMIEHQVTRSKKVCQLLDILQTKGGEAFEELVTAIRRDKTQTFIVKELHKIYEKKRNKYYALVNQDRPKELVIESSHLPKPAGPRNDTLEQSPNTKEKLDRNENKSPKMHEELSGLFETSPSQNDKLSHVAEIACGKDMAEGGYSACQKTKKLVTKQHAPLNSGIPLTVTDPEIKTLEFSVADEKITVTGPPNRIPFPGIHTPAKPSQTHFVEFSSTLRSSNEQQQSLLAEPQSMPSSQRQQANLQNKFTKQQKNQRKAAASKMSTRTGSKSDDGPWNLSDTVSVGSDSSQTSSELQCSTESNSSNGQGDTTQTSESLENNFDINDDRDISSFQRHNENSDTENSSLLLPATINDVWSEESADEGEITSLKEVFNSVKVLTLNHHKENNEISQEKDNLHRRESSCV